MGLSCLGEPKYKDIIKKNLFINFEKFKLNLNYFNHHKKIIYIIFLVNQINQKSLIEKFLIYLNTKLIQNLLKKI